MKDNPCRTYSDRYDHCHSECEAYKNFKIRHEKEKEFLSNEKKLDRISRRRRSSREIFKKKKRTRISL